LSEDKHRMPIHSVVYLLRREANSFGNLTGVLERQGYTGNVMLTFHYQVVRVWEIPVEQILHADPSLLPLALLSDLAGTTPESVVRRMDDRIQQEATLEQARSLWTSAYLLMGLSYPSDVTERLLSGVMQMRESVTYQKILSEGEAIGVAKGAVREAQNMLLLAGKGPLGAPDAATKRRIHNITEVEALESMVERIHTVGSWADLLK
jgi:predicted transposase YdaD